MATVEVIYATPETTFMKTVRLDLSMTVADALQVSGVFSTHPETQTLPVGIYSKVVELTTSLRPGDRVEIYRPLLIDPKANRRNKARKQNKK